MVDESEGRTWVPSAAMLVAIIGVFVATMPFLTGAGGLAWWNDLLAGLVLIGLGGFAVWTTSHRRPRRAVGPGRAIAVLGAWIALSPFLLDAPLAYLLMNVFMAPFLIVLGGYIASKAAQHRTAAMRSGRAA